MRATRPVKYILLVINYQFEDGYGSQAGLFPVFQTKFCISVWLI
jgi:hypothetical protein